MAIIRKISFSAPQADPALVARMEALDQKRWDKVYAEWKREQKLKINPKKIKQAI